MAEGTAGTAYLAKPEGGEGPPVLFLHSWWGLTDAVKARVDWLAECGFTVLAPGLLDGADPTDVVAATERLAADDTDATAALILSSVVALRAHSSDPDGPVGIVGQSMGGSWALWVATRQPGSVAALVTHYGYQDIDFADMECPVMCQFAELDPLVSQDAAAEMSAMLRLDGREVAISNHVGVRHFFAEEGVPMLGPNGVTWDRNDIERRASDQCWSATVEFLTNKLNPDHQS
ncbi:MAG: dienelactone hydrolase family protein [Microthrixaceae bacterium]